MTQIPHPPNRIPVLGDVLTVTRTNPVQTEAKLFRTMDTPVYDRKVGGHQMVMVGGAAEAKEVCNEDDWSRALLGPASYFREFVPEGMFTARNSDPMWHSSRAVLDPAFNKEAMVSYHSAMLGVADQMVERWLRAGDVDSITDECTRLTIEIIGEVGFGRSLGAWRDEPLTNDPMYAALSDALRWGSDEANAIPIIDLPRRLLARGTADRASKELYSFAGASIEEVRAGRANADSILGRMLSAPDENGNLLPDNVIEQQVITFLIAGHETTAALMSTALYYVARDPELQEQIRAEIAEVTGGSEQWDYAAVARMRTVQSVIQECLRLWPPAPAFFRIATKDTSIGEYEIPRSTVAMVVLLAVHRDKAVWGEDADTFDGLRFRQKTPREAFLKPWGTGPRSCIGRQFAQHEAALTLARLINRAHLVATSELESDAPEMEERGFVRPKDHAVAVSEVGE